MTGRTQRRMAMSRRLLKRRRPIAPLPPPRRQDAPERLTDDEQRELLEHDIDRLNDPRRTR